MVHSLGARCLSLMTYLALSMIISIQNSLIYNSIIYNSIIPQIKLLFVAPNKDIVKQYSHKLWYKLQTIINLLPINLLSAQCDYFDC